MPFFKDLCDLLLYRDESLADTETQQTDESFGE